MCSLPCFQPDSSGFPEGLLGQPFYGWFSCADVLLARFSVLATGFGATSLG